MVEFTRQIQRTGWLVAQSDVPTVPFVHTVPFPVVTVQPVHAEEEYAPVDDDP